LQICKKPFQDIRIFARVIGISLTADEGGKSNEMISFPMLEFIVSAQLMEQCQGNVLFSAPPQVNRFHVTLESNHLID
jgi:hypothetical protein